jgi:hypothetical protein
MNLDLLTKLVKLANNNPNENEANSAARRVCKLIAEANFIFNDNNYNPPLGGTSPVDSGRYQDIKRAGEAFWRSPNPFDPWSGGTWTGFKSPDNTESDTVKREREERQKRSESNPNWQKKEKCPNCNVMLIFDIKSMYFQCPSCPHKISVVEMYL